jgi:non-ribosomal peptide synthetase component F
MSLLLNYIKRLTTPNETVLFDEIAYSKEQLLIDCEVLSQDFFYDNDKNIYAIYLPRSYAFIVSILASLNSKHIFLPLDVEQPYGRTQDILIDSNAKYIVSFKDEHFNPEGYSISKTILLKNCEIYLWEKNHHNLNVIDSEAAYLIYSSGSTGKPKGILLKEKGVLEVILEQIKITQITSCDNFAWCLNPSFDASLSDIFVSLLSGATLFTYPYKLSQIKQLILFFNEHKITYSDLPPSLLKIIEPKNMQFLKTIIFGGEVCPSETLNKWSAQCLLVNAYGPTETTICSSMSIYSSNWHEGEIGHPLKGVDYYLQTQEGIVPIEDFYYHDEKEGMLLIAGEHLAIGYYNNEQLNQKHFIQLNGKSLYKTFDLIRLKEDKIIYLGRSDRQIKVNGVLICPEEIENYLFNQGYEVVVGLNQNKKLSLWYTNKNALEQIKAFLNKRFKQSFIPTQFQHIDSIPLNHNHKIDWKTLINI